MLSQRLHRRPDISVHPRAICARRGRVLGVPALGNGIKLVGAVTKWGDVVMGFGMHKALWRVEHEIANAGVLM